MVKWLLLLLIVLLLPTPALAEGPNQAGLVVQFGDGRLETRCVSFAEEQIGGDVLLARSGLEVIVDASKGMGITVCQIEGQGCAYPAKPCFCQCMGGGECAYWNYYFRDPGDTGWTYSALGALLRKVQPGSVEAWVWGDGHTPPADDLTFDVVCAPATPTPSPTSPPATATAAPTPTLPATRPPQAPASATASAPALAATASPPPGADAGPSLVSYWPFGLMLFALVAAGAWVWVRRGR